VIRNREGGRSARLGQNNVTPAVPGHFPAQVLECATQLRAVEAAGGQASHGNFDFARGHGRWHAEFGADSQALADCVSDVRLRVGLGLPLTDTARDRGALRNIRAIFVLVDRDDELHAVSYSTPLPDGRLRNRRSAKCVWLS